ncbi:hypothetical protein [Pseudomonas sp. TUM22785]|uniref:hypothetical protein n=1 Tax=Pseudomonas sp. TUM22785 TaxID=3019098 RepID=UPI002306B5EB|nr:hypothetical protein [Pseudomonas sp. TUM22785]WCD82992.1 hypothetical protein PI990_13490 [Pseudomonas sp. TUM22785]
MNSYLYELMQNLTETLQAQADAIDRLVTSNNQLLEVLLEEEGSEAPSRTYMDGSPIREAS